MDETFILITESFLLHEYLITNGISVIHSTIMENIIIILGNLNIRPMWIHYISYQKRHLRSMDYYCNEQTETIKLNIIETQSSLEYVNQQLAQIGISTKQYLILRINNLVCCLMFQTIRREPTLIPTLWNMNLMQFLICYVTRVTKKFKQDTVSLYLNSCTSSTVFT